MSDLIKDNPIVDLLTRHPWLAEIQHNVSNLNDHMEALNKKFNQQIFRQMLVTGVYFDSKILEQYKQYYLKPITVVISNGVAPTFVFQLANDFIITFMVGRLKDDSMMVVPDFHATNLKKPYDFIMDNKHFIVSDDKKSVGFGG